MDKNDFNKSLGNCSAEFIILFLKLSKQHQQILPFGRGIHLKIPSEYISKYLTFDSGYFSLIIFSKRKPNRNH